MTAKFPLRLSLFALLLAVFAPVPAWAQATKIIVSHAPASDFIPAFVAKEKGIFAKHGLDVTLQTIANITLAPAALVSGSLHISTTTPTNILLASEAGLDIVGILGGSRLMKSNPRVSLVTRPGVTVTKADDLRGKKVGVPGFNGIIDLFLRKWLLNNKVPLNQVTFVESLLPQMADMIKAGHVDAVTPIEPAVTRIVAGGIGIKSIDFYSEVNPNVIAAFWIATRGWADANRKSVEAFRAAYTEAIAYVGKNPDEARQLEQKYLGITAKAFPTFSTGLTPSDLEFVASLATELGVLRKPVDLNKLVWK